MKHKKFLSLILASLMVLALLPFGALEAGAASGTTVAAQTETTKSKPSITKQPLDKTIDPNETAEFSVTATGTGLTYKWQVSKDGGSTWSNVNSTTYPSAKTKTLSFTGTVKVTGFKYRCVVSNSDGSVTSNAATLVVEGKPIVKTQPVAASATEGEYVTFTAAGYGDTLSFRWQVSKNGGSTWKNIDPAKYPSADEASFTFRALASMNGYQYRCVISNSFGSVKTKSAKLTVKALSNKPVIQVEPEIQYAELGEEVYVFVGAQDAVSYQWEYSKNNGKTWLTWSGKTASYFTVKASTTNNGCMYRCKVSNSKGSVYSEEITLFVTNIKPRLISSPSNAAVTAGKEASFTCEVGGWGYTFQWQVSKDGGANWYDINFTKYPSARTFNLTFTAKASMNGYMYRCIASNEYGLTVSNSAKLTVK